MGDIKREKTENFWMGACARGREGILKQKEFLCAGNLPHRQAQGGDAESGKTAKQGLRGQKTEKAALLSP